MNFGNTLISNIKDEKGRAIYSDPQNKFFSLQHQEGELQAQVRFKDVDKYGVVLDYLSVRKTSPIIDVEEINRRLDVQAQAIQDNVTFLLEDFKLIELDTRNKCAQLRSYPPHDDAGSKYYYEIVLDEGSSVHFQRYAYSKADKRYEKITSQLTAETFSRLAETFADILEQPPALSEEPLKS